MSLDHYLTTEPEPSEEWAECDCCGMRKPLRQMWVKRTDNRCFPEVWTCDECCEAEDKEEPEPCTDIARRQGCTCSMDPYAYEEVRISRACPLHGNPAPEYEYEDRDAR